MKKIKATAAAVLCAMFMALPVFSIGAAYYCKNEYISESSQDDISPINIGTPVDNDE